MGQNDLGEPGGNTELERRAIRASAERRMRERIHGTREPSPWDYDDETHRFARRIVWGTFFAVLIVFFLVAVATADFALAVGAALATVLVIACVVWLRHRRA